MSDVTFNIYGGTNQILPNATKGEQHFYGDQFAEAAIRQTAAGNDASASDDAPASDNEAEQQLALYIINKERAKDYTSQLRRCTLAREVGGIVATMVDNRDITKEQAVMQVFIDKLVPFLANVGKGKTIDNLRTHINNALEEHKSLQRAPRGI